MRFTQLESEPLDFENINLLISSENKNSLFQLDVFEQVNSTNAYLLECAKNSVKSGWVCFANQQTNGRGRLGRSWFSPPGANIYCSILHQFTGFQADLSTLSLAVGVMVANVLRDYGIQSGIELKWPNDVLYSGRKLGGILLESLPEKEGKIAVVIGIGINLKLPQQDKNISWIDISEITGQPILRNYLAGLLVNELLTKLPLYQHQGFKAFKEDWETYDYLKGKIVTIHFPSKEEIGLAQGVNEHGELILKTKTHDLINYKCGEVSVRLK